MFANKLNIFFAASPLHLICLNEYIKKFNIKNFKLILLLHKGNDHALNQMYKTLEILKLKIYFIFWIPKSNLIRYFFEMILIMYFKFNYSKNYLRFFIIDFRNSFMHSLRRFFANAEFVLIDDGFYTFVAYEKFISRNIFLPFSNYKSIKGKFI